MAVASSSLTYLAKTPVSPSTYFLFGIMCHNRLICLRRCSNGPSHLTKYHRRYTERSEIDQIHSSKHLAHRWEHRLVRPQTQHTWLRWCNTHVVPPMTRLPLPHVPISLAFSRAVRCYQHRRDRTFCFVKIPALGWDVLYSLRCTV